MDVPPELQIALHRIGREIADQGVALRVWWNQLVRSRARVHVERLEPRMLFSSAAPGAQTLIDPQKRFLDQITTAAAKTVSASNSIAQPSAAPAVGGGILLAISLPASASPSTVSAKTTTLSIVVIDVLQQSSLIYTWTTTGAPPGAVSFSVNGTNSAATTTATFAAAGNYNLQVTVTAPGGGSVVSSTTVQVNQTATSVAVSPASPTVTANNQRQFAATLDDQFGNPMASQPGINWSLTGAGTLSGSGLYTAPAAAGTATVKATMSGHFGTAPVTIIAPVPNVAPTVSAPGAQSVSEGGSLTLSSAAGNQFTVADSDSNGGVEEVQLIATNGTLTLGTTSNITLRQGTGAGDTSEIFDGTLGNLNAALNGLAFTPTPNYFGPASVQIWIDDLGNSGAGGAITTTTTLSITVNRSAHTPSATGASTNENSQTSTGLVITPNALDASMSGFLEITGITGGSLFEHDGVTPITNGQFITFAQGQAGLRFTPATNSTASGAFDVQASTSGSASGLGGSVVADTIAVNPVPQLSAPASGATNEDSVLIFSSANADAIAVSDPGNSNGTATVTLGATDGTVTLASTAGLTINSGSAIAATSVTFSGSLAHVDAALNGLQFSPATHFTGLAGLAVSASEGSNTASGIVPITVVPVAHTPTITNAKTVVNQQTTNGLVVTLNPLDGAPIGFIEVTGISGGTLFQNDGVTVINSGDFITTAQAEAGLKFTPTSGSVANGSFDIQASTANSIAGLGGSVVAATITVAGPPVNQVPGAQSTTEDTPLVFGSSNQISVSDGSIGAGTDNVTLTAANGTITLAGGSGVIITNGSGTNDPSVSFTGSIPQLRAALNNLVFTPLIHFSGSASLQMVTADPGNVGSGGALSDTSTIAVNVSQVAHTPSVTPAATIETAQTSSGLVITPNPLDFALSGFFKITAISNGALFQADGVTPITPGQFITFAQGEAGLTFTPNAGNTTTGSFVVQASTSASNGGLGGSPVIGTVAITRKPTLTVESTPLSFIEGSAAQIVSPLLTVSEPNGRPVTGATVRLNGFVAGQDALQFVNQNGISGSWDAVNGVLTLTGSASAAVYQSALESVTYFNSSADPSQATRSAQFAVTDALFTSQSVTRGINVVAINNAPAVAAPATQSTIENVPLVFSAAAGNGIVLSDVDGEGQPEQLTLTASAGTLATSTNPGNAAQTLTLTGSIAELNQQLDGLTFTPALNVFQPATITVSIDDLGNTGQGGPQTAIATINIDIAPVAHTPSVTDDSTVEGHRTSGGLVITSNAADQGLNGFYQITSITGGTLVQQNGVTPVNNGDFITFAQGAAGLRFSPSPGSVSDGSFTVQASVSSSAAGLGGLPVQATIDVIAAPLVVRSASLDVPNESVVTITPADLKTVSPAGSGDAILYTVLSLPADGTLLMNGVALGINGTFTAANISQGAVQYDPGSGSSSADGFQFVATDAVGRTSGASTFHIVYNAPVNVPLIPAKPALPPVSVPASTPSLHGAANDDSTSPSLPPSDPTVPAPPASSDTTVVPAPAAPASTDTTVVPSANPAPAAAVVPPAAPHGPAAPVVSGASAKAAPAAAVPGTAAGAAEDGMRSRSFALSPLQIAAVGKTFDQQSRIWAELDKLKSNMSSEFVFKAWAGTASFVSVGMSLAYFMWIFRAGSLISSLLSSMPAWNFVDPLPILESMGSVRSGPDDDEGLESLVNGAKKRK